MKEQYVGDVSDYRKYALLRALAAGGRNRIGVCWLLTPSDTTSDGRKLTYLSQPDTHRRFDPDLFDILASAASQPDRRRLAVIEESGAVPRAVYFNDLLPDSILARQVYMERAATELQDAELVFFDPDNGLETKLPKGRKNSNKYVYFDEVAAFYSAGKSILVYQHFPHIPRQTFTQSCVERLRHVAPEAAVWTFSTAHVVFYLLVHPESPARLAIAALDACHRWDGRFIKGEYLG